MKRAALYVRVSTDEQKKHGLSVDNQIDALYKYCEEKGYSVAGLYNDAGISARKKYTKRPALLQLLNDCQNKKVDIILFTKLDRWFRNVAGYYEVQSQLDDCGVPWRAIWEDYETETSAGILKLNVLLSVNQSEADRASERVKATFEYKRQKGDYVGSVPFGYVKKDSKVYKGGEMQDAIEALFKTYLINFNMHEAKLAANACGFITQPSVYIKILKNPIYSGTARNGYSVEPYITKEEHERVLAAIKANARGPAKYKTAHNDYIFSGLAYCEKCGKRLYSSTLREHRVKTDTFWEYPVYKCRFYGTSLHNVAPQISEKKLEQLMLNQIEGLIDQRIKTVSVEKKRYNKNTAVKKKSALETKLKRLADLYAEGDIELTEYHAKRDAVKAEIAELETAPVIVPSKLPSNWREIYDSLDKIHKRAFWMSFVKKIYINRESIRVEFL